MTRVAIVYHSGYGHTARQAEAVQQGAASVEGMTSQLILVSDVDRHWDDLKAADAIIFGTPTYMGSASAEFKKFMDASSKVWMEQSWKDKLAAGFTNSGSWSGDKLNTLTQLWIFSGQHSMIWVSLGLMPGNNSSKGSPEDMNRIGSYSGAMAQSNVDEGADKWPSKSDLETARHLGKRVASLAGQIRR